MGTMREQKRPLWRQVEHESLTVSSAFHVACCFESVGRIPAETELALRSPWDPLIPVKAQKRVSR